MIHFRGLIILLFLLSAALGACVPQAGIQPGSDTPAPVIVSTAGPAGKLPAGSPLAGLMALLSAAGIPVQFSGPGDGSLPGSTDAHMLNIDGAELRVYEFSSQDEAAEASGRISPDGGTITGLDGSISSVHWIAPPHFWLSGSFIVQYLGEDGALLESLVRALGKPFAGAGAVQDDVSHLWREIRQAGTGIGFAVPCWWEADELSPGGLLRSQTLRSYDQAFFDASSVKGEWKDGLWPEGAYKLDLTIVEAVDPNLSAADAYRQLVDPGMEEILDSSDVELGANTWMVMHIKSLLRPEEPAGKVYLLRLAPDRLLLAAAYPYPTAIESSDVLAILASFVTSSEQSIQLPQVAPQPGAVPAACTG